MKCREFVDFLMAYLEGELDARARRVFEEHMRDCPPCEEYLGTYRETVRLGRLAWKDEEEVPEEVPETLVQAILAARRGEA